jgi:predicted DNA binding CopG/RHH family protein
MAQFEQVKQGFTNHPTFVKQGSVQPVANDSEKPGKMKRLTLDLPEELHRVIKINAAKEGMTMAEKLRALLSDYYGLSADSRKPDGQK